MKIEENKNSESSHKKETARKRRHTCIHSWIDRVESDLKTSDREYIG